MRLQRYHGLGNDYLVMEDPPFPGGLDPRLVRALCDRRTGVGGDGVLLPGVVAGSDAGLRIYNPDGSEAEKSGNGLRIFARWLVDHRGAPRDLDIALPSETVRARVDDQLVTVAMGRARFEPAVVPVNHPGPEALGLSFVVAGETLVASCVGLGNPHCVVFVEACDLDALPWREWGRTLEVHPSFPNRTNVQVAQVLGPDRLGARIWERGAGETASSGSSSCAVAAVAVRTGRLAAGRIEVVMPGGTLQVDVSGDLLLSLCGPVQYVGGIEVSEKWLGAQGLSNRDDRD